MATWRFAELYLTDILVDVALYAAHVPFIFTGCYFSVVLESSNEMRLIIKVALISYFCQ